MQIINLSKEIFRTFLAFLLDIFCIIAKKALSLHDFYAHQTFHIIFRLGLYPSVVSRRRHLEEWTNDAGRDIDSQRRGADYSQ